MAHRAVSVDDLTEVCGYLSLFPDPSHERAGGNLRYFERLLEEERGKSLSNQTDAGLATQENLYERPVDYLPERDVYESLCRGEGIKMVRPGTGLVVRLGFCALALGRQRGRFHCLFAFFSTSAEAGRWAFADAQGRGCLLGC